jgi:hypothetical protein
MVVSCRTIEEVARKLFGEGANQHGLVWLRQHSGEDEAEYTITANRCTTA